MKSIYVIIFLFSINSFAKTLVYCSEANPDYFNPQMSISGAAFDASTLLYDRLVEFNFKNNEVTPGLATKWTLSEDKKTYTFYLRKGVSFSSQGDFVPTRPLSADDVLFTFNRQKQASHPYYRVNGGLYKFFKSLRLNQLIVKLKKVNKHTVQFVLREAHPLFIQYMAMEFASILSKEYGDWLLEKKQPKKIDFEPVGTGPFVLTQYIKGSVIRYKRNENYFKKPAQLEKIVFAITPDPTVRFQKLKQKECHIISKPQPVDIPLIKKHKGIKVAQGVHYNMAYLAMNTSRPPLNDVKVRKAIAHALNRPLYIKSIYKGAAQVAHTPVPSSLWGHHKEIKSPEYSVEKAKKLLKEAGYEEGLKLQLWTLPISRPYNPQGKKMGELMQDDLKKIGIQVQLRTYDWSTYISKSSQGKHDLVQMGWVADIPNPSNFLQILLSCKSVKAGSNLARWCNRKYDRFISRAIKANQSQAIKWYHKAQEIFNQEMPFIPLVYAYHFTALSSQVKNYTIRPFGAERFYHLSLKP